MTTANLVIGGVSVAYCLHIARRFGLLKQAGAFASPTAATKTLVEQLAFTAAHSFPFGKYNLTVGPDPTATERQNAMLRTLTPAPVVGNWPNADKGAPWDGIFR